MEQPLDLSQRESTVERNPKVVSMDMEEPICQYTNCSCPLKHILSLDKNDHGKDAFRPRCETISSVDYIRGQVQKRPQEQAESSPGLCHPKRRKLEQYKQSICRSSSDTNLYGYGGPTDPFKSFVSYPGDEESQRSIPEEKCQSYWKSSQAFSATNTYPSATEESSDSLCSDVKTVHKYAERLPKKRSHARNFSYDNSFQKLQHSGSDIRSSLTPSPQSMSADPDMSQEGVNVEEPSLEHINLPDLDTGPRTNGNELRQSIMAELHQENDDEDVQEFRKRFFGSLFSRAKQNTTKTGTHSALDILISNKCINKQEFRPRNSHIDQIIRGEKPGKLCLMDIVELQVEIGLA